MVAPSLLARGRILASCAFLVAAGCTASLQPGLVGHVDDPAEGDPDAEAQAAFTDQVAPLLDASCASCHAGAGLEEAPPFLMPNPDVRATLLAWPSLVVLDAPGDSMLLRRGAHDGRAWTASESGVIRSWIGLESVAAGLEPRPDVDDDDDEPAPATGALPLVEGPNEIDLTEAGLPGTILAFRVDELAAGIYLTELRVTAGPDGAHLVHPNFLPWIDGLPHPELAQPLDDVDLLVEAGADGEVGTGALVLPNVPRGASLAIEFEVAETLAELPADDGALGPCVAVRAFTERARPQLAERCQSCHGGDDDQATGAIDMTRLDDLSVDGQTYACLQLAPRIRMDEPASSALLSVVDPSSDSLHPYRFGGRVDDYVTFSTALLAWIDDATAEQEN